MTLEMHDVQGWIKTRRDSSARRPSVEKLGYKQDGGLGSQQSQICADLGVPPGKARAVQSAVTGSRSSSRSSSGGRRVAGETRDAARAAPAPPRPSSLGLHRGTEKGTRQFAEPDAAAQDKEEDGEGEGEGEGSNVGLDGGLSNFMDTQELLANEDMSQLERMHSQQQREADRHIKQLVRKALPGGWSGAEGRQNAIITTTPGTFIGGVSGSRKRRMSAASQHLNNSTSQTEDGDAFAFDSGEDSDDGLTASALKRRKGAVVATSATAAASDKKNRPVSAAVTHNSSTSSSTSTITKAQAEARAMQAVRQFHNASGSGSGRNDDIDDVSSDSDDEEISDATDTDIEEPDQDKSAPPLSQDAEAAPPPNDAGAAPPSKDAGAAPPPEDAGAAPPPGDAGAALPPKDACAAPPPKDSIAAPPPKDSGAAPPPKDSRAAPPPKDSGAAPSPKGSGGAPSPKDASATAAAVTPVDGQNQRVPSPQQEKSPRKATTAEEAKSRGRAPTTEQATTSDLHSPAAVAPATAEPAVVPVTDRASRYPKRRGPDNAADGGIDESGRDTSAGAEGVGDGAAGAASCAATDYSSLTSKERWDIALAIFKRDGWSYKKGSGITSWIWLKPGVTRKTATRGVNLFESQEEVLKHLGILPPESTPADSQSCARSNGRVEEWGLSKHRLSRTRKRTVDGKPASGVADVGSLSGNTCHSNDGGEKKASERKSPAATRKKRERPPKPPPAAAVPQIHPAAAPPTPKRSAKKRAPQKTSKSRKLATRGDVRLPGEAADNARGEGSERGAGGAHVGDPVLDTVDDDRDADCATQEQCELRSALNLAQLLRDDDTTLAVGAPTVASHTSSPPPPAPPVSPLMRPPTVENPRVSPLESPASDTSNGDMGGCTPLRRAGSGGGSSSASGGRRRGRSNATGYSVSSRREALSFHSASAPSSRGTRRGAGTTGPLHNVGVILTGCDKKYRDMITDLGGTEIVFPPKKNANCHEWLPKKSGSGKGARAEDINRRRVLAVAMPESYRTSKYMFAVAAGIDIVHPVYLDHISGARCAADTTNYLLPLGRSALSNRRLIMPSRPTFDPREHRGLAADGGESGSSTSLGGNTDKDVSLCRGRPFQGKRVLLHLGRPCSPSWDLILWVAGATVATIEADGCCVGGFMSSSPPTSGGGRGSRSKSNKYSNENNYIKMASNLLAGGGVDCFISLDESADTTTRDRLMAAALDGGVQRGTLEWAAQCIAHGRMLAYDAATCPWFSPEAVVPAMPAAGRGTGGAGASGGAGSGEKRKGSGGGVGKGQDTTAEIKDTFFCHLTETGLRLVAGDYVFLGSPGGTAAAAVVARVVSFERVNGRVMAMVSEMDSQDQTVLPRRRDGVMLVPEKRLGKKVIVIDQSSELVSCLYASDPSVFFTSGSS